MKVFYWNFDEGCRCCLEPSESLMVLLGNQVINDNIFFLEIFQFGWSMWIYRGFSFPNLLDEFGWEGGSNILEGVGSESIGWTISAPQT